MQFVSLIGVIVLLTAEGFLLTELLLGKRADRIIACALAYPVGVFLQTLLFFILAVFGLPWTLLFVMCAHGIALTVLFLLHRRMPKNALFPVPHEARSGIPVWMALWCGVIVGLITLSSIVYAVTIPSFYWDAFTNWAMRSVQTFTAEKLLLTGVVQPQYPILIHSLQISPMLAAGWHDWLANTMTLVLSLTGFSALFLLIRRAHGTRSALVLLSLILGVPLVIIHLRQGYADVHLSLYILLSAVFFDRALRDHHARSLLLSAVFCAAAMWTKLEGIYAGVVLWLLILGLQGFQAKHWRWLLKSGAVPLVALTSPWIVFLWVHGLKTSPHGFRPALHLEAFPLFLRQLLGQGMFGLHWWAIFVFLAVILISKRVSLFKVCEKQPSLLWGMGALGFFTFTYLCTKEVIGLIQADNFSRAMMMPTLLLTYGIGAYVLSLLQDHPIVLHSEEAQTEEMLIG